MDGKLTLGCMVTAIGTCIITLAGSYFYFTRKQNSNTTKSNPSKTTLTTSGKADSNKSSNKLSLSTSPLMEVSINEGVSESKINSDIPIATPQELSEKIAELEEKAKWFRNTKNFEASENPDSALLISQNINLKAYEISDIYTDICKILRSKEAEGEKAQNLINKLTNLEIIDSKVRELGAACDNVYNKLTTSKDKTELQKSFRTLCSQIYDYKNALIELANSLSSEE